MRKTADIMRILREAQNTYADVTAINDKLQEIKSQRDNITASYGTERVKKSPNADKFAQAIIALDSARDALLAIVKKYADAQSEAIKIISMLDNPKERAILTAHYLDGKTFKFIAADMHMHEQTVTRKHKQAIGKLMNKRWTI